MASTKRSRSEVEEKNPRLARIFNDLDGLDTLEEYECVLDVCKRKIHAIERLRAYRATLERAKLPKELETSVGAIVLEGGEECKQESCTTFDTNIGSLRVQWYHVCDRLADITESGLRFIGDSGVFMTAKLVSEQGRELRSPWRYDSIPKLNVARPAILHKLDYHSGLGLEQLLDLPNHRELLPWLREYKGKDVVLPKGFVVIGMVFYMLRNLLDKDRDASALVDLAGLEEIVRYQLYSDDPLWFPAGMAHCLRSKSKPHLYVHE